MHKTYAIRKATIEDIPDIIRLRRLMFTWMNYSDSAILDATDKANEVYFFNAIPEGTFHGWVAESNNKIIATGGLVIDHHPPGPSNLTGKLGYIMNMSVEPEFRKQGIAKELFKTILLFLKENNIVMSSLHATDMGRKLYEKFGFSSTNEMRVNLTFLLSEDIIKL